MEERGSMVGGGEGGKDREGARLIRASIAEVRTSGREP